MRADFVTVASHELRTPLATGQVYAQALADDDIENQREGIAEILAAAHGREGGVDQKVSTLFPRT
ncbi:MAG TPA: histidine kinase dimerization/phospho-acceptor domain-containing protein [Rubricoccaceae bacterium]